MEATIRPVRDKDRVTYHCKQCGECCRNVEEKIMLEAYDAYRLGQHLRKARQIESIEDVYEKYAHPILLSNGFPVYTLNTEGNDDHCVFLTHGRCAVYDARLRVCRTYPFTVTPGARGRRFAVYQCFDSHAAHFCDGSVSVKDWMHENFTKTDHTFLEREAEAIVALGALLRQMSEKQQEQSLFQILYYRYYNYDLDQTFPEQHERNQKALLEELRQRIGKER